MSKKFLASCLDTGCEWSRIVTDGENFAKALTVCHTVTKHPERYREVTGRDPDVAKHEYREFIEAFRKDL